MVQVSLPPDTEALLRERAHTVGKDVSSYAASLLSEAFSAPNVDHLLATYRKQVEESGITNEELDAIGESLHDEVWRERQATEANKD